MNPGQIITTPYTNAHGQRVGIIRGEDGLGFGIWQECSLWDGSAVSVEKGSTVFRSLQEARGAIGLKYGKGKE